ncbi:hypothetical protein WG66_008303 [Moniliophthora roreri]|nr:hypothetical protein WG66_008303 [Moniliophthora roreri]
MADRNVLNRVETEVLFIIRVGGRHEQNVTSSTRKQSYGKALHESKMANLVLMDVTEREENM